MFLPLCHTEQKNTALKTVRISLMFSSLPHLFKLHKLRLKTAHHVFYTLHQTRQGNPATKMANITHAIAADKNLLANAGIKNSFHR